MTSKSATFTEEHAFLAARSVVAISMFTAFLLITRFLVARSESFFTQTPLGGTSLVSLLFLILVAVLWQAQRQRRPMLTLVSCLTLVLVVMAGSIVNALYAKPGTLWWITPFLCALLLMPGVMLSSSVVPETVRLWRLPLIPIMINPGLTLYALCCAGGLLTVGLAYTPNSAETMLWFQRGYVASLLMSACWIWQWVAHANGRSSRDVQLGTVRIRGGLSIAGLLLLMSGLTGSQFETSVNQQALLQQSLFLLAAIVAVLATFHRSMFEQGLAISLLIHFATVVYGLVALEYIDYAALAYTAFTVSVLIATASTALLVWAGVLVALFFTPYLDLSLLMPFGCAATAILLMTYFWRTALPAVIDAQAIARRAVSTRFDGADVVSPTANRWALVTLSILLVFGLLVGEARHSASDDASRAVAESTDLSVEASPRLALFSIDRSIWFLFSLLCAGIVRETVRYYLEHRLLERAYLKQRLALESRQEIGELHRHMEAAAQTANIAFCGWQPSRDRVYCNAQLFRLLGEPFPEGATYVEGQWWRSHIHPEDRAMVYPAFDKFSRQPESFASGITFRVVKPNGDVRWLTARGYLHTRESDTQDWVLGLVRDVTDEIKTQDDLTASLARAQKAVDELEGERDRQRQMFAVISHELRTPIASMAMMLEQQKAASSEPTDPTLLEMTQHLLSVLDGLRTVINPDRARPVEFVRASVRSVVENAVSSLGAVIAGGDFVVSIDADEWASRPCHLQAQLLRQSIINLVNNAVLHSGGNTIRISIASEAEGPNQRRFRIDVEDNGRGIAPDVVRHIFEPYRRGDTSATGSGLGLSICRELARQLHGDLQYQDNAGGGARFRLTVNLSTEAAQDDAVYVARSWSASLKGARILLAEDDAMLRKLTSNMLSKEGAYVRAAKDGLDALGQYSPEIDLVLTDIFMPNMDGCALTRDLRSAGYQGPLIGVSAGVITIETQQLLDAGADAVIPKPIEIAKLYAELARLEQARSTQA